ncbi:hypothetical protein C2G38_2256057, partial [Gigaspora rosea]
MQNSKAKFDYFAYASKKQKDYNLLDFWVFISLKGLVDLGDNNYTNAIYYQHLYAGKKPNPTKSKQLEEFFIVVNGAIKNRRYVKYGLYVEKYAKAKGWDDILCEVCPDIEMMQTKVFLSELQYQDGVSNVVKIFSKMVDVIQFEPNDLLLSGVLDIQNIEANYKELRNAYKREGIWDELVENIQIKDLPNHLK